MMLEDHGLKLWQLLVGWALGTMLSVGGVLRWLFLPRIKLTIGEEVDEKLKPVWKQIGVTGEAAAHLPMIRMELEGIKRSIDHDIGKLAPLIDKLATKVSEQGLKVENIHGQLIGQGVLKDRRHTNQAE